LLSGAPASTGVLDLRQTVFAFTIKARAFSVVLSLLSCDLMTVFLMLLAMFAAVLITELVAANRAPFGYQDEHGFHYGKDPQENSTTFKLENPS